MFPPRLRGHTPAAFGEEPGAEPGAQPGAQPGLRGLGGTEAAGRCVDPVRRQGAVPSAVGTGRGCPHGRSLDGPAWQRLA